MPGINGDIEKKLWTAADQLRANSKLKSSEYSVPVLGLIFLRFADHRYSEAESQLAAEAGSARRSIGKNNYQALGVMYLPEKARYAHLLNLPEGQSIGTAVNQAMELIEQENEDLRGVLPHAYTSLENDLLVTLLKLFNEIPLDEGDGDLFGNIYEYFLGEFARAEGAKGGEFFTPVSLVKLIVEVIEPYRGRILDPACGSAGMFVQSANFVRRHQQNPAQEIALYGQEKTEETIRLARMSLAVHGLGGSIKQGNTYYEDNQESLGRFDFVMANPPFNVDKVDKEKVKGDPRFPYGLPTADNANYLWIQAFWSALDPTGRAGFVMANSAADARSSELEIRKKLIEDRGVDVMIAIGPNFFYTVTLPCTLWFLDRAKKGTPRADHVLFIDARHIYRQVDRAHRDFTAEQIEFIANIVRLYRGEKPETTAGSDTLMAEHFPDVTYRDVPGLCKVATLDDVRAQGYSLNPGRYVGVAERADDGVDFYEKLEELAEELERLNAEARELEDRIAENVAKLLEAV